MSATLLNPGFCKDDKNDQTHNLEDLDYENTQRAFEQEIPKLIIEQLIGSEIKLYTLKFV